ncbi:hypothetical protein V500_08929 [Pseudogymnoascus sp. VKM F-4518 (FW-2643)]|nr:hypothetical protein V500_08929 [Pseudogymnoascus sp. VKM F-4518 (FW-2643)]
MAAPTQKRARTDDEGDDLPKLSKIRACSECKKHKIKCERLPVAQECIRCGRFGFKCIVNNQQQRMIEDDIEWKREATAKSKQLEAAIVDLLRHNQLPPLSTYRHASPLIEGVTPARSGPVEQATAMTRDNSQEPDAEPDLVSAPMHSLYEVTKLRNIRSDLHGDGHGTANPVEDFISTGRLPLDEAEKLFRFFSQTMNQFLWGGIVLVHPDLSSVRRSSSLLTAAILAVASLHIPNHNEIFDMCYTELTTLVSNSILNRYHSLDEIRGLCIGAFWLSDLSWKLSGHAMRIATEMNLHRSLQKLIRGQTEQFERAELWFLLYVCDHHFSIAYGRPPVIYESPSIKNYEEFLRHPSAVPGDVRLICQVALFITLMQVYHEFGSEVEHPLEEGDFSQLRTFNVAIEQWRLVWQPRSADSPYVGSYPSKGVVLHYHFAKFQVNSLALRAVPVNSPLSMERKEAANIAISSAISTLNMLLHEPDIRGSIVGAQLFTHTMVAFCAVFLLKVAWLWDSVFLSINKQQVEELVQSLVDVMSNVSAGEKHLTYHIANGLTKMLDRFRNRRSGQIGVGVRTRHAPITARAKVPPQQQDLIVEPMDNSGQRPLLVPGFGGMSIYHELGVDERFADTITGWEQKPAITAPEMAMLQLMSDLTDKSDWNVDVFNNAIVAKWREETFKAQEAKAQEEELKMRRSRLTRTDSFAFSTPDLRCEALVDPSLFPLAYGKTSVLTEGQVCLHDAVESFGGGKLSPRQPDERLNTSVVDSRIKAGYADVFESEEDDDLRRFFWSSNFQLLPCEVEFYESGTGTDAHITSYINNLHPIHYQSVYYFVEKLISLAIKPWNECLVKGEKARWPIRIRTYGLTWEPEFPMALVDRLRQDPTTETFKEAMKETGEFFKLPSRYGSVLPPADLPTRLAGYSYMYIGARWRDLYTPNIPEPGISFSYNDWKDGRNGAAIEKKCSCEKSKSSVPTQSDPDHEFYSIRLEDMFRDQGLQVIVKIGSIAPSHTNDWHMDGYSE